MSLPATRQGATPRNTRGNKALSTFDPRTAEQASQAQPPAEHAPLGNRETTPTKELNASSERVLAEAMKALWRHSNRKAHKECHRMPSGAEVGITSDGGTVGLRNSRSRLSPMAARRIYRDESLDMQAAVIAWVGRTVTAMRARRRGNDRPWLGHGAAMPVEFTRRDVGLCTFTLRHKREDSLADLVKVLQAAWNYVNRSRRFSELRERYGIAGWHWVFEHSHGWANGHHPHRHMLLFFERRLTDDEVAVVEAEIFELWREGVVRAGGRAPSREHGVDLRLASRDGARGLAQYVTKGVALEASLGSMKHGRGGNRSPLEVLVSLSEEENPADVALWHEIEEALCGVRWHGESRGLRDLLRANGFDEVRAELEAELVAEGGSVPNTVLVALSRESWRELAENTEARVAVMEAARDGETAGERCLSVEAELARRGIPYRRVMVPVDEYEMVLPSASRSVAVARDAWGVVPLARSAGLVPV